MKVHFAASLLCSLVVFHASANPSHAGLIGYWPLDGNGAAVVGTGGVLVGGPAAAADRNGTAGGALAFDGALSQYVSIAGGGGLDGALERTISMWVKWTAAGQDVGAASVYGAVLGRQQNGVFSDNLVGLTTADPATARVRWTGNLADAASFVQGNASPGVGAWHHVAVTTSRGEHRLYIDGQAQAVATYVPAFHSAPAVPLTIGAWIGDGQSFSTSVVDDVAIWDRALAPHQVAALFAQSATPAATPDPLKAVNVTASSELYPGFNRRAANAADGVGHATTVPDGDPGDARGMWLSAAGDPAGWITFDYGAVQSLGSLVL